MRAGLGICVLLRLNRAKYNPLNSQLTHIKKNQNNPSQKKKNSGVFIEQLSLPLKSKEVLCCPPADLLNSPPAFSSFVTMEAFALESTKRHLLFLCAIADLPMRNFQAVQPRYRKSPILKINSSPQFILFFF